MIPLQTDGLVHAIGISLIRAALVLSQIGPDEPVLLIGSGLTAVDVILTLNRNDRSAPLFAISRRGLLPLSHLRQQKPAADMSELLAQWLDPAEPLTIRQLVCALRKHIPASREPGFEWQRVIDGLRPSIPLLWSRLSVAEGSRFLNHVRPFWEIQRHRMASVPADTISSLRQKKLLDVTAGSLRSARADADGIEVTFSCRGSAHTKLPECPGWLTVLALACTITKQRIVFFGLFSRTARYVATNSA